MTPFAVGVAVAVAAALRGTWSPCGLSMLSALNPMTERQRGHRFTGTAAWYVAGAAAGGAALGAGCAVGAVLWADLSPSGAAAWTLVALACVVCVASDTRVFGRTLPVHPRQVDERWLLRYRRWLYAGGFGAQIGCGFATYVMTAAVYLVPVVATTTSSPLDAFELGVLFGAVRGLGILVTLPARSPQRLRALIGGIERLAPASVAVLVVVEAIVAVLAAGAAGGSAAAWPASAVVVALMVAVVPRGHAYRHGQPFVRHRAAGRVPPA